MYTALSQQTDIQAIIDHNICVTKPYYALQNVHFLSNGLLEAQVIIENRHSGETPPLSASEAGRHLAILGSVALAIENPIPLKHYYLATGAILNRKKESSQIAFFNSNTPLTLQAEVLEMDISAKKGVVKTQAYTQDGLLIYDLVVSYSILKADLFQKLFRRNCIHSLLPETHNPYTVNCPLYHITSFGNKLEASLGVIQPSQCVGHFDQYPAMPIAILCSAMLRLGGLNIGEYLGKEDVTYAVRYGDLQANRLAFAGETVHLGSEIMREEEGDYTVLVRAIDEQGNQLARIEVICDCVQ